MEIRVEWQVWVFDEFDELESIHSKPLFEIKVESLDVAKREARDRAYDIIKQEWPNQRFGTFVPHIITLTEKSGVRHKIGHRHNAVGGVAVISG